MSKIINIQEIVDTLAIDNVDTAAPSNTLVGDAPLLDNGLNLMYAPQNHGKSYTAVAMAVESSLPAVFFDLESNSQMFVDFCAKNGVAYVYIGSVDDPMTVMKLMVEEIQSKYGKALIIIDSYSDMFPDDEGKMPQKAQLALGELNKYFMREIEMPVLLLDHATEQSDGSFKIEGNKSGKFKKTLAVLRLDRIGGDISNGTFVTVICQPYIILITKHSKQLFPSVASFFLQILQVINDYLNYAFFVDCNRLQCIQKYSD